MQHLGELAHDHCRAQLRQRGIVLLEMRRDPLHELEIFEHAMLHAIVENLHHHRSPVVQCRFVNLSDGPGRHRIRVEGAVKIRHGTTELAFNQSLCHTRRIRCDRRLELDQLPGDVVADDIRPQAQHLTELDPRGAQLGQRPPQPLTVRHRDDLGIDMSVDEPLHEGRADQSAAALHPRHKAVLREHRADLVESLTVAHQGGGHSRHDSLLRRPAPRAAGRVLARLYRH